MILLKDIFGQKSNQNKKLLLVDDIIVNGRAITEVFDFLRAMDIGKDCIYIWCDLLNMNANCLSSDAKERLETYREATETGWKAASNIFSQAITIFGRGYTSYIDTYLSYNLDSDVNKAILNFLRGDNERIIKSDALKENDVETYICYMELEKNGIIGEHKDISCLRFYVYKDAILVIPYLFIDSIKKEKAYDYAVSLLKKFEIVKIPEVFGIAIQNKNYDLAILFLQWTVNEIGKKLVSDFFKDVIKKNGIEEAVCLYVTEHSETFKFEKNTVPPPNSDAEYICDSNKYSSADIEYCSNIFKRKLMDQGKIEFSNGNEAEQLEMLKAAFKGYKFTVKEEDQRRANTEIPTVNRLIGIRPADMVEIVYNVFTVPEEQKKKY